MSVNANKQNYNSTNKKNISNNNNKIKNTNKVKIKSKKNKRLILKFILFILIILVVFFIVIKLNKNKNINVINDISFHNIDNDAKQILSDEDLLLKQEVSNNIFFNIDYSLLVDTNTRKSNFNIFNYWQSHYPIIVKIFIEGDNNPIYSSGVIMPNNYIDNITLNKDVQIGEYNANVIIYTYNPKTRNESQIFSKTIKLKAN